MYKFIGRFVYLEELTTENNKELFDLMKNNENEYRLYVSDSLLSQTYEDFQKQLDVWFFHGRNFQFLVYKKDKKDLKKELIGTIFFYGWNIENKTIKISAFFVPKYRKTVLVGEALGAAALFSKEITKIKELRFDCYIENKDMIKLANELQAQKVSEGPSSVNPERILISFMISEQKLNELLNKFIKFENREMKIK